MGYDLLGQCDLFKRGQHVVAEAQPRDVGANSNHLAGSCVAGHEGQGWLTLIAASDQQRQRVTDRCGADPDVHPFRPTGRFGDLAEHQFLRAAPAVDLDGLHISYYLVGMH